MQKRPDEHNTLFPKRASRKHRKFSVETRNQENIKKYLDKENIISKKENDEDGFESTPYFQKCCYSNRTRTIISTFVYLQRLTTRLI
jgi:hypothetical protein